jgi:amidase
MLSELDTGVAGLRIGFDAEYAIGPATAGVSAAMTGALETLVDLGAVVVDVDMPPFRSSDWYTLCSAEAALAHADYYPERADEYGGFLGDFLAAGLQVTGTQYVAADRARRQFAGRLQGVFNTVDVIACPSMHGPAEAVAPGALYGSLEEIAATSSGDRLQLTGPFDFSGSPTLSVPMGFEDGLPLSLQLVGRHLDEATLCRVGHTFERATDWHSRHPD